MNAGEVAGRGVAGTVDSGDGAGAPTSLGRKSVLMGMAATVGLVFANAAQESAVAASTSVPTWAPSTAYVLGQQIVSPNNDVVAAKVAHTSSAAYVTDKLKWNLSSTYGLPSVTSDAVFFVSPTGSSSNDGLSPGAALRDVAAAATALPAGGGTINLMAGTHNITTLPARSGITYRGAGRQVTKIRLASGSMLAPTAAVYGLVFEGLDIATNGRHLIDLGSTGQLYFSKFMDCILKTNVAASSLVKQRGSGNFVGNLWLNCDMYRLATATVPAFDIVNTAGGANGNVWKLIRMFGLNGRGAPAWRIEASVSGSYANDNSWEDIIGEQNLGGLVHLYSCNGATFKNVLEWDGVLGYTADVIKIDKSATNTHYSTNIHATNSGRRGGILGAGVFDFNAQLTGTTNVVLIGVGNSSAIPVIRVPRVKSVIMGDLGAGYTVEQGFRSATCSVFDAHSSGAALTVRPSYASGQGLRLQEGATRFAEPKVTSSAGAMLTVRKFSDSADRAMMDSGGKWFWGAGAGTFDLTLFRAAVGVLGIGSAQVSTTAPAAGGAGALPSRPMGYITVNINGTNRKIPYY